MRSMRTPVIAVFACLLTTSVSAQVAARQTPPADQVNAGARLYQTHCASCHGTAGDQLPAVNLLRGKFVTRDLSDDDIVNVIVNGTRNGMMAAANLSKAEASHVVAYLRSEALGTANPPAARNGTPHAPTAVAPPSASAVRGRMLFETKDCFTCHRLGSRGSYSGPPLNDIAFVRSQEELERSILDPDAEVVPHNRSYRVVTLDGVTVTGRLLNHDTFKVQLIDSKGSLLSFVKANLRSHGFVEKSPMPSYRGRLSREELTDLVAFLATLK
jgi:putative heme-binding domain-containing protein